MNKKKALTFISWTLSIIIAGTFLIAASGKFSNEGNMYENFLNWGYSYSFLIIVGISEAVGGVLLFVPRFRNAGIGILIIIMLGTCYTHLINYDELGSPFFPSI